MISTNPQMPVFQLSLQDLSTSSRKFLNDNIFHLEISFCNSSAAFLLSVWIFKEMRMNCLPAKIRRNFLNIDRVFNNFINCRFFVAYHHYSVA